MVSTIKEMDKVAKAIRILLELYRMESMFVVSNNLNARMRAVKTVDFLTPKICDITTYYVKKFCNTKSVSKDQTRLLFIRKIIEDVRDLIWLPLSKTYALLLKVPMDKKEKVIYD